MSLKVQAYESSQVVPLANAVSQGRDDAIRQINEKTISPNSTFEFRISDGDDLYKYLHLFTE